MEETAMSIEHTSDRKRRWRAAAWPSPLPPPLALPWLRAGTDEAAAAVHVHVHPAHDRQTIDGFGGSLAYWGDDADDTALRYAFDDLGATLVRVPGDVTATGDPDQYRAVVRRVAKLAPGAKVLVSFWQ